MPTKDRTEICLCSITVVFLYRCWIGLASRPDAADGDAVVAGVRAAFEPAVRVDADDLADAEPVRPDGVGDDIEAGVGQRSVDVRFEAGLQSERVATKPEGPGLVKRGLRVEAV